MTAEEDVVRAAAVCQRIAEEFLRASERGLGSGATPILCQHRSLKGKLCVQAPCALAEHSYVKTVQRHMLAARGRLPDRSRARPGYPHIDTIPIPALAFLWRRPKAH